MDSDEESGCLGVALGYIGVVLAIVAGWEQIAAFLAKTSLVAGLTLLIAAFFGWIFMGVYFQDKAENEDWPVKVAALFLFMLPFLFINCSG